MNLTSYRIRNSLKEFLEKYGKLNEKLKELEGKGPEKK